jgi:hypothetical protein
MANRSSDTLFQLIKSLEKSEKRNFKLFVNRNTSSEDLKIVQLFDAIDKMDYYDEELLLKKNKEIKKQQIGNLRAHLYKQILRSLRLLNDESNIDIQLHEQMDFARILYNKGLYLQSLKILEKIKLTAKLFNQITYLQQAVFFEKKIEALYITRSMQDRAEILCKESDEVNCSLQNVSQLSNLSLQLYSRYIRHGHCRSKKEELQIEAFLKTKLTIKDRDCKGFYERLYFYQCHCWSAFIRQDFLQYYRYSEKWVRLFSEESKMALIESALYIKGMHNLMSAHFYLGNAVKLNEALNDFKKLSDKKEVHGNFNNEIQFFICGTIAQFNLHFLRGDFSNGIKHIPLIEKNIARYGEFIDTHRILVFYYKIACLYFGSGDFEKSIDYLNKIINRKGELRNDLQCYARLLHLITHYELGNEQILDYLIKSVYRYMAGMESFTAVEEAIFKFIRKSFTFNVKKIKPELEKLLTTLKQKQNNRYEKRSFIYLDFISWLESKIENISVQKIIEQKYLRKEI